MVQYMKLTKDKADEYLEKGYWRPFIFADFWERNAKQYPDDEAIVDSSTRLSWSEANLHADRVALALTELGISRQDVMIEQTQDCWEHILMRLACEKAGLISLPLMRTLREAEIQYILNLTRASSMNQTPLIKVSSIVPATCRLSLVFPTRPVPVRVNNRVSSRSFIKCSMSFWRPIKLVSWTGRLCWISEFVFIDLFLIEQ